MKLYVSETGAREFTFRQSGFKDFLACPEMARRKWFDGLRSDDSDATVTGTALHLHIEHRCQGEDQATSHALAKDWLRERIRLGDFDYIQVKSGRIMLRNLAIMVESFEADIWRHVPEVASTEEKFGFILAGRGVDTLRLSGTTDMRDVFRRTWDWKSAGDIYRQYEQWQIDRYYPQPTFYCAAAAVDDGQEPLTTDRKYDFTFAVMQKGTTAKAQLFETSRTGADFRWLAKQLWAIVDLYDGVGPDGPWPMNDQSWLCSKKWCPAYSTCKGA